jgi:tetratricopeptide (TPR) repeat protein
LLSIAHYGIGQAYMNLRRYASAVKAYIEVDRRREDEIHELQTVLSQSTRGTPAPAKLQMEQRLRDLQDQKRSIGVAFWPPAEVLLALGSAYFRNGEAEAAELTLAEKNGFRVNPQFKTDLKDRRKTAASR